MIIRVTREAVCLADDQLEPLELTLDFGADATLEDFAGELVRTGFLHFSSTHRTLVGWLPDRPLLRICHRWGTHRVEYLAAADTRLATVAATIHFGWERRVITELP